MRRAALLAFSTLLFIPASRAARPEPGAPAQARPRVVSLHPAATEILLALEAAGLLAARMEGDGPLRAGTSGAADFAELPSVGEMLTPNLELLASTEPDLVIAWAGADLSALTRVVERRGGRVEAIAVDRLGDVPPAIHAVGAWVGRAEAAARLALAFESTLRQARAHPPAGPRPRVLWIVWSDPIVVAGPGTFIQDVIEVAGGENAAASVEAPWPRLGMESIVALDPDVVVWPEGPGLFNAAELTARGGWRSLRAVEEGRVVVVDAERYHDAGPEIADAALDFARNLRRVVPR